MSIRLVNLAQTLNAETGLLGNEIVLRGDGTSFEIRIPLSAEALAQVSRLVQLEAEAGAPSTAAPPPDPVPPQYMRTTNEEDLRHRQEPEYMSAQPEYEYGEDDDDALELAAIGEI